VSRGFSFRHPPTAFSLFPCVVRRVSLAVRRAPSYTICPIFSNLDEDYNSNYLVMSRGFVKEDDQEELPIVPQRAYLPDGVTNFVTPFGMSQLLAEKQMLEDEKNNLNNSDENEKRIELNYINAKLQLLNTRIATAKTVILSEQPQNEIRFGATVTLKTGASGDFHTIQIVGVDEADISRGKVSFLSPVSRVLINKKTGDKVTLMQAGKEIVFEIINISY
jgi:transcription elongation factor GreB